MKIILTGGKSDIKSSNSFEWPIQKYSLISIVNDTQVYIFTIKADWDRKLQKYYFVVKTKMSSMYALHFQ